MRRGMPLLLIFCALAMVACAGNPKLSEQHIAATELDYLDKQKVELQARLGRFDGTQIERRENAVAITISCDSFFENNSERIKPATYAELGNLAEVVKKYPETKVRVDAHTDCIRSEEENLALSELQAWTIKKALVDKGVSASRVAARGWGESKPVASNATEAGRHANRRLTIVLMPNQP